MRLPRLPAAWTRRGRVWIAVAAVLMLAAVVVLVVLVRDTEAAVASEDVTISTPSGPGESSTVDIDATLYLSAYHPGAGGAARARVRRQQGFDGGPGSSAGCRRVRRFDLQRKGFRTQHRGDLDQRPRPRGRRCPGVGELARGPARGRAGRPRRSARGRRRIVVRRGARVDARRQRPAHRRDRRRDHLVRPGAGAVPQRRCAAVRCAPADPSGRRLSGRRRAQARLGGGLLQRGGGGRSRAPRRRRAEPVWAVADSRCRSAWPTPARR